MVGNTAGTWGFPTDKATESPLDSAIFPLHSPLCGCEGVTQNPKPQTPNPKPQGVPQTPNPGSLDGNRAFKHPRSKDGLLNHKRPFVGLSQRTVLRLHDVFWSHRVDKVAIIIINNRLLNAPRRALRDHLGDEVGSEHLVVNKELHLVNGPRGAL